MIKVLPGSSQGPGSEGRGPAHAGPLFRGRTGTQAVVPLRPNLIARLRIERMDERRIALSGEYDVTRRRELSALFESVGGEEPLAIDLSGVTYLDATALRELSTLRLRNPERPIALLGANANLRRVFALVAFDRVFDIPDPES
jgi:anti-anti-sigma regulatory factor